jgi:peptide/nickel transport system permease protein
MHKQELHRKHFRQRTLFRVVEYLLVFFVAIALLAPILSNDRPLYVNYKGHNLFPAFSFKTNYIIVDEKTGTSENLQLDITDWKQLDAETIIFPPVAYSPGKKDMLNADYMAPSADEMFRDKNGKIVKMPLKFRHWLGTNKRGEDVLAGIIYGTRVSLFVGLFSMLLASFLGLMLGSIAGYFGDHKLKTSRGRFITQLIGILVAWFYAFQMRWFVLQDAMAVSGWNFTGQLLLSIFIAVIICYIFSMLGKLVGKIPFLNRRTYVRADSMISRLIEVLISMPRLIIIVSIAAIAKPSLINLVIIIGVTSWTGIARLVRAEMLKIREADFISACRAMGFKEFRTMMRHALPNAIAPAIVAIAFGVASAILIESSLSFLNICVPPDIVTWGSMLAEGREYFNAWWLVVFPGCAIFLIVMTFNLLGDGLRDWMDKR